jgi:hypothetical protein
MIKKQFTLYVENRPGVLARLTKKLADSAINIEGISVASSADVALVQIVVSNAAVTRRVLRELNIAFTVQDVVLHALHNTPGSLARVMAFLSRRKINVNYVYATACECAAGCKCLAVISAPDIKAVNTALAEFE